MANEISKWKDVIGDISLDEYLDMCFGDKNKFRISRKAHRTGHVVMGRMISGTCFVLQGKCRYIFEESQFDLADGDLCKLPGGDYSFECLDNEGCTNILVWKIPGILLFN